MALSGTVPVYDFSTNRLSSETLVLATVTGLEADGQATSAFSNETYPAFLQRAVNILSMSGVLAVSGVASGMQCVSGAVLSGVMQLQREMAFRYADISLTGAENPARLTAARASLAVSGEIQFGT
jgi:hypothetical protein